MNKKVLIISTIITLLFGMCTQIMNVNGVVELPIIPIETTSTFTTTTTITTTDTTQNSNLDGDVNKDGSVNVLDLLLLKKILLNLI